VARAWPARAAPSWARSYADRSLWRAIARAAARGLAIHRISPLLCGPSGLRFAPTSLRVP